jgi:hypothetical protein
VGFFTKNDVEAGEELNFDYKYERYGQVSSQNNFPAFLIRIRIDLALDPNPTAMKLKK